MLEIKDKKACCGCQACMEACPAKCISMVADEEGFLYPQVHQADCLDCHLCEKVCPQKNLAPKTSDEPLACYAAVANDDEIRLQSSSGGVFSLLANAILERGGVVFGARFDDSFAVFHSYTETEEGLAPFRGSKYSQSDLRGAYSQVDRFLKENRPVLFTGTPCQIAGLRAFLRGKEAENLYLVSVVCHGAPSPLVWKDYLESISRGVRPTEVNMRNKENGWSQYRMIIRREGQDIFNMQATDTPFMRAFIKNYTLRPSCYSCQFRGNHGSDLTLGDYWSIEEYHPDLSDNKGTSLILVYSRKGQQLLEGLDLRTRESRYEDAIKDNPCITIPFSEPANRAGFWKAYQRRGVRTLKEFTSIGFMKKLRNVVEGYVRKLGIR